MYSFDELAEIVGTTDLLEAGRKYDAAGGGA
jgi:hypothetical protein